MCGSGYAPEKKLGRYIFLGRDFFFFFFYKFQMGTNDFLLLPLTSLHDAFTYGVLTNIL